MTILLAPLFTLVALFAATLFSGIAYLVAQQARDEVGFLRDELLSLRGKLEARRSFDRANRND